MQAIESMNPALIYTHEVKAQIAKGKAGKETVSGLVGQLKLRRPNAIERLNYTESVGVTVKDGEVSIDQSRPLHTIAKMIELSLPHYLKVDLARQDGSKILNLEELLVDDEGGKLLQEVAVLVFKGFPPSKN